MSLAENFWRAKACWKGNQKQSPRDKVTVEDNQVHYILWYSTIATWNQKYNTLQVNDCGWSTPLTFKRLNTILSKLQFSIYSVRGTNYIFDVKQKKEYRWEGTHTINLSDPVEINPHNPRKINLNASKALRKYYASALNLVNKHKKVITQTDKGVVCLFPSQYCSSHFSMSVLCLSMDSGLLKAYLGKVACSKVYSVFMKNDAVSLSSYLVKYGVELGGLEVLLSLNNFNVDIARLPLEVLQQLALLKLVEA
ncbi:MAG: hypothetical protein FWF66_00025 [Candidatus Bathyarchaeota archaeon]|nr:hypothetical protein [Candidatus Termiticorpusculum sp.]